ncbi:phage tail protein [Vibrio fluvialis]|nr:phage tail protein [Vibrio fluvialis]
MNTDLINRGVILTTRGEELIIDAKATGRNIQLKQFGVGDGGSDDFNPTYDDLKALTSVPGEWDKRNVNDGGAVNGGFEIEGLIPAEVGEGRWMRIIGIYTADNQLMYVFLYPSWQKPVNNGNLLIEVPWKATIGVSDTPDFQLTIDPSLVAATQQFVKAQDKAHTEALHPHAQYAFSGTQLISADVMTHLIRLGGVHVFTAPAEIPLPVADDGQWFVASVHPSVDLKTGECAFTAPEGETINHAGTAVPKTWFVATNQEFRFVRINGEWCV